MLHLRWTYLACAATAMCSSVAGADALHGFCSDCGGGSSVGAAAAGPPIDFGFWDAGKNNTGTYFIDILTPDNGFSSAPSGSYAISGAASGTAALFSSTAWTGGKLDNYLGISASPTNPLNAWLHATQSLDAKAMGYWVFQANLGLKSLGTSSGTGPLLKLNSALPQGSVIVAFLETSTNHGGSASQQDNDNGKNNGNDQRNNHDNDNDQGNNNHNDNDHGKGTNSNSFIATANGSALFETAAASSSNGQPGGQPGAGGSGNVSSGGHGVPEPGTAALLLTALLGFGLRLAPWRAASRLMALPRQRRGN